MPYPPFHPKSALAISLMFSAADFNRHFPEEGDYIEFKAGTSSKQLQDSIVAFSNADGGVILIGVDDAGTVTGRPLDSGTADDIHGIFRDVHDPGRYQIEEFQVDGTRAIALSVAKRNEGFAQTSKGIVKVRRGSRDDALFGADLQRFINERSTRRFETTPTQVSADHASPALVDHVCEIFGWEHDVPLRLQAHGFIDDDRLTIAGALFLLERPGDAVGKASVEILRYRDDDGVDYDRRDIADGPIYDQLERAVARVTEELGSELVVLGHRRFQLPRLPEVVIREAVSNAIAHRSYEIHRTPVRVEIRPGFVRIQSPGGLPEPVTIENMRETSAPRNIDVIRTLRLLGLAEDAGRGIDVMQDVMQEEMLDPPRFSDLGHAVEVLLPVRSPVAPVERAWIQELERRGTLRGPDRLLLVHAARGETLTNGRVREILAVDESVARQLLQHLRDERFLEQRGKRGGASYVLSESLNPPLGLRLSEADLAALVEGLAESGPVSNQSVRDATGLDRGEALSILQRLVREGRLEQVGARRGTRYVSSGDHSEPGVHESGTGQST